MNGKHSSDNAWCGHAHTKNVKRKLSNGLLLFFNPIRHGITLLHFQNEGYSSEKKRTWKYSLNYTILS